MSSASVSTDSQLRAVWLGWEDIEASPDSLILWAAIWRDPDYRGALRDQLRRRLAQKIKHSGHRCAVAAPDWAHALLGWAPDDPRWSGPTLPVWGVETMTSTKRLAGLGEEAVDWLPSWGPWMGSAAWAMGQRLLQDPQLSGWIHLSDPCWAARRTSAGWRVAGWPAPQTFLGPGAWSATDLTHLRHLIESRSVNPMGYTGADSSADGVLRRQQLSAVKALSHAILNRLAGDDPMDASTPWALTQDGPTPWSPGLLRALGFLPACWDGRAGELSAQERRSQTICVEDGSGANFIPVLWGSGQDAQAFYQQMLWRAA